MPAARRQSTPNGPRRAADARFKPPTRRQARQTPEEEEDTESDRNEDEDQVEEDDVTEQRLASNRAAAAGDTSREERRLAATYATGPRKNGKRKVSQVDEDGESPASISSDVQDVFFRRLAKEYRWNVILCGNPKAWSYCVQRAAAGLIDDFSLDTPLALAARTKVLENTRSYKHAVLEKMTELCFVYYDDEKYPDFAAYKAPELLLKHFERVFSVRNLFYVFYFLRNLIDYDKSSELGQYYLRSLWINIGIETKLWADEFRAVGRDASAASRLLLLDVYDGLFHQEVFDKVTRSDFFEIEALHNEKIGQNHRTQDRKELATKRFMSLGPPPAKTSTA